ncbi:MAG: hypothetical protein AUJ74_06475 [Candidatus Omnitrophica bacterium CG1_02_44_16]|nr:MAG: hypothetical protein AUJ74_06475 [Candidatus Omnitrophica bacterium CG1_02_44_16]PIY83762.1 MAG: hypothetical protein COY78_00935 [Candidatus Omnitrophica bacterium CG_4_10_14_0_8_um_filter_44_12]PIZ84470.1 MAG: hypothetical protein COX96_03600 [Candidatus Omnitrophica bacterium CG_4_10_14_0_2_um_filter_44_9]
MGAGSKTKIAKVLVSCKVTAQSDLAAHCKNSGSFVFYILFVLTTCLGRIMMDLRSKSEIQTNEHVQNKNTEKLLHNSLSFIN